MDAPADLIAYGRRMAAKALVTGTAGNLSLYDAGQGLVWTTPTAMAYDAMALADLVALDPRTGERVHGTRRPTSEMPMHLALYRARPELRAIVHTHSLYATMFAVANLPIAAHHYAIVDVGHEVPVVPYARFGSEALAQNVLAGLGQARAVLLQNHGAVAVGDSLAAAFRRAETVEWLAHLAWGARLLGPVTTLSPAQLEEVVRGLEEVAARYPDLTAAPSGADA
jgi:L-fuculose-phosphate aldolase